MARRSDIRRIGAIMRHGGADGSLVAWVEAELERVDFADPVPGCLATLVDDLTGHERQLIVAALATVALEGPAVRSEGLDAAVRLGRELGVDVLGVERILRDVSGWSMNQAQELARRKLPATTSPAALAEARRDTARSDASGPSPRREPLRADERAAPGHGGGGPASPPLLDEVRFELPDLTEAGADPAQGGHGVDVTDPSGSWPQLPDPTASARHTERMDDLADVIRRLEEDPEPSEPSDDEEPLGEDPPTVEMTPDAVRTLLQRKARERAARVNPPRFSSLASALGDEPVASDGSPTLGLEDDHNELLSVEFDTTLDPVPAPVPRPEPGPEPLRPVPLEQGLRDLPELDWGEGDAFTVSDFTLSERVTEEGFDVRVDPSEEEPTQFLQVPPEVQRLRDGASDAPAASATPPDPDPTPAPNPTMDLDLDDDPEAPEERDLDEPRMPPPAPSLDDVALDSNLLEPPPSDKWVDTDPHSTAELLELDLDEAPASGFDRAFGSTGSLPVRPDPSQDLHTGEGLLAAPLASLHEPSLDSDERELSLDPDTGDRIAVAGSRAVHWTPPGGGEPAIGLPVPTDEEALTPQLQPLREGLAAYWAPQALHPSDGLTGELRPDGDDEQGGLTGELRTLEPGDVQGGLTGELKVIDPGDVQGGLTGELRVLTPGDVQGGLTGELRVLTPGDVQGGLTGELRAVDPNDIRDGLTSELRPMEEAPPERRRPRRHRRGSDGITQDLTLLVDGDPTRRKGED